MSRTQQAFTIIELITIIVLLGILSAVAIPRLFDRRDFDERLYYDELITAVRYAQKQALSSGCQIKVDIAPSSYSVSYNGTPAPCPDQDQAVAHPGGGDYSGTAPTGVISSTLTLAFASLGQRVEPPAGNAVLTIARKNGGQALSFTVHPNGFIEQGQ